jgi:hypothetical protein
MFQYARHFQRRNGSTAQLRDGRQPDYRQARRRHVIDVADIVDQVRHSSPQLDCSFKHPRAYFRFCLAGEYCMRLLSSGSHMGPTLVGGGSTTTPMPTGSTPMGGASARRCGN